MLVQYKVLLGIIHHFGFATSFSFGLWLSDIFLKIHLHYCIWLATFASSFSLTKITENPKTSSKFQLMAKCFFFVFFYFYFFLSDISSYEFYNFVTRSSLFNYNQNFFNIQFDFILYCVRKSKFDHVLGRQQGRPGREEKSGS